MAGPGTLPRLLPNLALCLLLFGCAAQTAFREGKELVAHDKVEQGLQKFQEAVKLDPEDARYKSALLETRERSVNQYSTQADMALEKGQVLEAEKLYQRVLVIDPRNERAKAGLQSIALDQKHRQSLKEVAALIEKKDIPGAQAKLRTILTENPRQSEALALRNTLAEKTTAPPLETQLAATYKKPISIEFKDASLKQVFDSISRSSGLNFIFDRDVRLDQKTTLFLKNSNIENAVYFTLLANQLEQQILNENTIMIFPNTPAKQKDYQEIVVKSFFLANTEAKSMANTIKTILKTRDIAIDEKLNMLVIRDSQDAIRQAEKLIAMHDIPEPEVMLEVEVLEVKRTRLLNLGISWPTSLGLQVLPTGTTTTGTGTTGSGGSSLRLSDLHNIPATAVQATLGPVTLNAQKQDGDSNLLANPRIRVRNHEKAKIMIGDKVPNITSTATSSGFVSESINYVDVGLNLQVEPTIYLDNDVAIKVSMEVSSIVDQIKTTSGSTAYRIGTRNANTVLRLRDGETQVLAGLINDEDRRSANKVPALGEVPILGRLFGSTNDNTEKTEIVLSITPHLIRNILRPDAQTAEFRAGTDSSNRQRPDNPGGGSGSFRSALPAGVPAGFPPAKAPDGSNPSNPGSVSPSGSIPSGSIPSGSIPSGSNPGSSSGGLNSGIPSSSSPVLVTDSGAGGVVQPTQLHWQGQQKATVGDTFLLQLTMESDQLITSLPIAIGFDNKVLQVAGITEGSYLKQGGAQTNFSTRIDPNGQILLSATRTGGNGPLAASDVANITFRAIAPATDSKVQILTVAPVTAQGRSLPVQLPQPFLLLVTPHNQ
jgi:general secretion pathway protein D